MIVLTYFVFAFWTICGLNYAETARILGVFPTPSKSHWLLGSALMKELALDGHDVTDVSPFQLAESPANYHHVKVQTDHVFFDHVMEQFYKEADSSAFSKIINLYNVVNFFSNTTLTSPEVKELLRSDQKFDLIILEIFLDDALLGFAEHFKCPVVGMTTHGTLEWINTLVGNPQPLSYVPHVHIGFSNPMDFWQRLTNVLFTILDNYLITHHLYPAQEEIFRAAFPNATRSLSELRKDAVSLVLVNNHFSLSYPRPYVPNMIEIGGFHVKRKVNQLPENIRRFIENSSDGVIYFSMGSNLKPSLMGKEKLQAVLDSFAVVPHRIIWKYDNESMHLDPSKYLISKWLPQDDILAHPNVKLFITHGGLLSCTESIHHGKPIIGIPIFADQQMNMDQAEQAGWGVTVKFTKLNKESLGAALSEVLNNDKYTKRVQVISKRLRDQPLPPMDMAKFWINYVIRHDGAKHLKSPRQRFNFIQLNNIDVYVFILVILVILMLLSFKIIRAVCSRIRKNELTSKGASKSKTN
ncbi:UDP-glycosyltransferase UGT5-like [Aedes albopictus]|uniref:UDP-glucuronosyltransferase n=1 Tax=Aedes albopictus TaxID=7160 RepID=A0ABM1ZAB3_AEDAL